jgi:hypothetical protein
MLCTVLIRRPKEGATREEPPALLERVAASAAKRHERIEAAIGGSVFRGTFEVAEEVDGS